MDGVVVGEVVVDFVVVFDFVGVDDLVYLGV